MQESNGSMRTLTEEETEGNPKILLDPKVIETGKYFKIKHCYFKISNITPEGIEATGVSRKEYFRNRKI